MKKIMDNNKPITVRLGLEKRILDEATEKLGLSATAYIKLLVKLDISSKFIQQFRQEEMKDQINIDEIMGWNKLLNTLDEIALTLSKKDHPDVDAYKVNIKIEW